MDKYYIKTEDWEKIYAFLKSCKNIRVENTEKIRTFTEAVYFIMRTGAQWRELPTYYGKWRSVHKRFESWARKGLGTQILEHFTEGYDGELLMRLFVLILAPQAMKKIKESANVWVEVKAGSQQKSTLLLMLWDKPFVFL